MWLKDLLQMLADLDSSLAPLEGWPLLPVKPSRLRALKPSSQVSSSVSITLTKRALATVSFAAPHIQASVQFRPFPL